MARGAKAAGYVHLLVDLPALRLVISMICVAVLPIIVF